MGDLKDNDNNINPPISTSDTEIEKKIESLLEQMTFDEKISLLHGYHFWRTREIKRLGIPSFRTTDGPLGVAWHSTFTRNTRFPATISLASTWDPDLAYLMGKAMGAETRATGRHCLLAPGINIHRTPLCGRTFEYLSEDPFLIKEIAVPIIKGIQDNRVAACLKHYIANNQEYHRFTVNAVIEERALNEIYLKAFGDVVKEAKPWTIMACYNRVNGKFGAEHDELIRHYLMEEFGFDGFVMSDWGATKNISEPESCIKAGLSLEMPSPKLYDSKKLKKLFKAGKISEEEIDFLVKRILRVMGRVGLFDDPSALPQGQRNVREHQELARKIAEEGMVLLKNEGELLPLPKEKGFSIYIAGPNADKRFGFPIYGGSSAVFPKYEITPKKGIKEYCKRNGIKIVGSPEKADAVLFIGGISHFPHYDSEQFDRYSINVSRKQVKQIRKLLEKNRNLVVVLINGSPLSMDSWLSMVPAVLEAWYPGMECGNAIARVLFGEVNPGGKLPLTFPRSLHDSPPHSPEYVGDAYPGDDDDNVYYYEGIYVGYRWFDKKGITPLFPFGYGLSYTTFNILDASLDKPRLNGPKDSVNVRVKIKNTGKRFGKEVIQVYIRDVECSVDRPVKELKGFKKVSLEPGEEKTVEIPIKAEDLAFYSERQHKWIVEPGQFEVLVGTSSRDIMALLDLEYLE